MLKKRVKFSPNLIIILCWLVYTFSYLGRYNYNANISLIMDDYEVSHADAGLVTTCFFFAYAAGQFIHGVLCKRYNKYITFPLVLLCASAINLAMSFKIPFYLIKYLWFTNGILQSILWPTTVSILGENLDSKNMDKAIMVMSTTSSVGTILAYSFASLFAHIGYYRLSFMFGTVILAILAIVWLILFSPNPVPQVVSETKTDSAKKSGSVSSVILMFSVLAVFAVIDNFVKDGACAWLPAILKENYHMADSMSILLTIILPIFGIFGAVLSVNCNKIIKDFVLLGVCFFVLASIFTGILFFKSSSIGVVSMMLCFAVLLCLAHAINNIVTSIAPLKFRDKINSGKIAGIMNGCCYLGSTLSSYGLGAIADGSGGWGAVFLALMLMCVASVVIGIMWFVINFFVSKKH